MQYIALLHNIKKKYPKARGEKISDDNPYQILNNQKVISEIHRLNSPGHNQKDMILKLLRGYN